MNEEVFNMSIRKFLKTVGVRSQSEIEHAVAAAIAAGKLKGKETFPARMQLKIDAISLDITLDGEIKLE
jgi:ribosomal protein L1